MLENGGGEFEHKMDWKVVEVMLPMGRSFSKEHMVRLGNIKCLLTCI